jgi:hypothetical protein
MRADYLTLSNDRKVRVEFNWNVAADLILLTGVDIDKLIGGNADVQLLRTIAWCCAVEGEAMDGKEFELSELEFGRLVSMEGIVAFTQILVAQSKNSAQKKSPPPEKGRFPRVFFRRKH